MSITNSTKKSEDEESTELPPPPDGGWGWVVVFGSFMIHIITDGVTYSFGVFYDEFLTYFKEGQSATSWILSILVGITLCSGPISSSFVNRWGCRTVTISGAILASLCLIISSFATNVTTLYFTIGIGTGLGFGLVYLPAIVSVTTYFEKRRSLATGIAVCGSGFGTFIFAPLINLLLTEYGWRGAILIISALVLKCVIFGALFRPLEYERVYKSTENLIIEENSIPLNLQTSQKQSDGISINKFVTNSLPINNEYNQLQRPKSIGHFSMNTIMQNGSLEKNGKANNSTISETSRLALSHPVLFTTSSHSSKRPSKPLNRPDVFYQGSLQNIPSFHKSRGNIRPTEDTELMTSRHSVNTRRKSTRGKSDTTICGIVPCSAETKETLQEMLDLSLFKDPIFIIFTVSNFFTSVGFNVPYVYLVSKAKSVHISAKNASMLLSVIGIANTIGRIVLGYFSDNPKVNRLLIYNLCLTVCGIATMLSAFCLDFYSLTFYGIVFGFTIGAYVGLTSVILVDLLGLEKLTNAFGLLLLFQGIASLIGPPIAGALYDSLQSYDPGFYVAGATIAFSGLILFAIPPLQRWQEKKKIENLQSNI